MIGRTISHYKIEAELGRGGMGVVYRARDEKLQRQVALKVLSGELFSHAERRARLLAEARAAAALNHPGITTIYEVGEEGEQIFIVMEMVSGGTMRALMAAGPPDVRVLTRLGIQIAEALEAAHARGVVHGDIKPENIVILPEDRVKLLDFGVARQAAENTLTLTRSIAHAPVPDSQTSGTLAYMAPEQLLGDPVDARADLYALGVVLYELAAGHRPFPGPAAAMLMSQILHDAPPALDTAAAGLSAALIRVVHKLLEKQPGSRYQSAREVQVDLNNFLRDLDRGPALPAAIAGKRAVAVLPFKLLTPNLEDAYLSVALADALINHLSASGELLVRPTSTVMRYASQPAEPLVAARELNVQTIVEGSIQKLGSKLRVHVQAWNAADGVTIFSAKHDAEITDLFGLQDRISETLAGALGLRPAAADLPAAQPPTKNAMAYELYLRAAERISHANRWDMRTAIEMLENATRLDPKFTDAWGRLGQACFLMVGNYEPRPAWIRRGEAAIRCALSLDPRNADAHCAHGQMLWTPAKRFQNRAALKALEHALRLSPGCHSALVWKCLIFLHVGLLEQARQGLSAALATHPEDVFVLTFLGQVAFYQGNSEEAADYFARAIRLSPANVWSNIFFPTVPLYLSQLEQAEEKIRAARRALGEDPMLCAEEALLWAKRGEACRAEQSIHQALRTGKSFLHTHHVVHTAALASAALGKPARAVTLLAKASATGLPNYPVFRDDPHFRSMHNYKPFQKLLGNLKREWESYRRDYGKAGPESRG